MDDQERNLETAAGTRAEVVTGRWQIAWRVGLIGGVVFLLTTLVSSALVFGIETVLPGPSLVGYLAALSRIFIWPAVVLALLSGLVMGWRWQRWPLWAQSVLFGLPIGVVGAVLTVTIKLIAQLSSRPDLGFAWDPYVAAIGREILEGRGLPLFLGAAFGWCFAHLIARRQPA